MRIQITDSRQVWLFTAAVTGVSVLASEGLLGLIYATLGNTSFALTEAALVAAVVPILVATPAAWAMGRMARDLGQAQQSLKILAETDPLTGLINRRSFFATAERLIDEAESSCQPLTLLIFDADHFKGINDHYGHATGDEALKYLAGHVVETFRKSDPVCRLGGEEFAVLLPDTNVKEAGTLVERVVQAVGGSPLFHQNAVIEMTISCGYADTSIGYDMNRLFRAADEALYEAKHRGRNRAVEYPALTQATASA